MPNNKKKPLETWSLKLGAWNLVFLTLQTLVLSIVVVFNSFAVNPVKKIDSLFTLLKTSADDTSRIDAYIGLYNAFSTTNPDTALYFANQGLALATSLSIRREVVGKVMQTAKKQMAMCYNNIGIIYYYQGNYPEALKNHFASLKIREELKNKTGIAASYNNIGIIYYNQGAYPEALKNYFASLKIKEELKDKAGIATSYNNIGLIYYNQGAYPKALKNYFASLKICEERKDKAGIAASYNNVGIIYRNQGNLPEALKNYFASLKIHEELKDKAGIAGCYNNIGLIYYNQAELLRSPDSVAYREQLFNKALKNYFASLKIHEELKDKDGIATCYINLGTLQTKLHKLKDAQDYLNKALSLSIEIGSKDDIKASYNGLAELDSTMGNYKLQITHYKQYIIFRDSLNNEETHKKTMQSAMTYEFEKKEAATKAEQDKKDAVAAADKKRERVIRYSVMGGLVLMVIIALLIFRSLRITRKQKIIIEKQKHLVDEKNNTLNQQNEEIRTQRDEIETQRDEITAQRDLVTQQKDHIEEIYHEISDSINYAKRIQQALLPEFTSPLLFPSLNGESLSRFGRRAGGEVFVLFQPKDVVSGDFYWATGINEFLIVTVADCTGHGVPGAFMSMLGISFLNEIVRKKEVTQASQVLDQLRASVIDALKQKGEYGEQKDGMDITLILLNTETLECQFAGANNPLYLISNVTKELTEIKPDKMPVAIYENMKPFTNHVIQLQKEDIIYLASDGYKDQFGGPKHKKFLSKNMKELLKTNSQFPMSEQKELLEKAMNNWKGENEQIDDITVMGIKL